MVVSLWHINGKRRIKIEKLLNGLILIFEIKLAKIATNNTQFNLKNKFFVFPFNLFSILFDYWDSLALRLFGYFATMNINLGLT